MDCLRKRACRPRACNRNPCQRQFGVERMSIVGGPKINTAFLEAGLLDEISLLRGAGIDGRGGMPAVFDGLVMLHDVTKLKLIDVKKFDSDAVWIRYRC